MCKESVSLSSDTTVRHSVDEPVLSVPIYQFESTISFFIAE